MSLSLEWFGCTTFRVRTRGLTLWFDTFVDRVPAAEPVGVTSSDIDEADFVFVSHAHFDHVLGADTVARNTGAPVVANYEVARLLRHNGVNEDQVWPTAGGHVIDCGHDVLVHVLPSVHSHLWASTSFDAGAPCLGDLGVRYQERRGRQQTLMSMLYQLSPEVTDYARSIDHRVSPEDGGQLVYVLETPDGGVLFSQSSGYWSGIVRDLRPDVAVLAITGRPNVDGEPFQGSLAEFVVGEAEMLRPDKLVFCHHDAWMPPIPPVDVEPAAKLLADRAPAAHLLQLTYGNAIEPL